MYLPDAAQPAGTDHHCTSRASRDEAVRSCPASELRTVQTLLWDEIRQNLPAAERDEVRRVIGISKIDENQQIFDEASALAEIMGDVRLKTDESIKRRQSVLLQTPQRALVESGVRMLLENIHRAVTGHSAATGPTSNVESLVATDAKERSMLKYMATVQPLQSASAGSARPATPRTPPSRPMSSNGGSRPSTAGTAGSGGSIVPSQVVDSVRPKLNVYDIDSVVSQLRDALKEEHNALLEDVEYLHRCLEDVTDMQAVSNQPAPAVSDLIEYESKLQATWIKEEEKYEHVQRVTKMMEAVDRCSSSSAGKLRAMVEVARDGEPTASFRPPSRSSSIVRREGRDKLRASSSGSLSGAVQLSRTSSSEKMPLTPVRPPASSLHRKSSMSTPPLPPPQPASSERGTGLVAKDLSSRGA